MEIISNVHKGVSPLIRQVRVEMFFNHRVYKQNITFSVSNLHKNTRFYATNILLVNLCTFHHGNLSVVLALYFFAKDKCTTFLSTFHNCYFQIKFYFKSRLTVKEILSSACDSKPGAGVLEGMK